MKFRRQTPATALLATCALVLGLATASHAQTAQKCLDAQSRSAGTTCRGMAKCYVKAMKRQVAVDPQCISDRNSDLLSRYSSVEAGDNCLTEPAGPTVSNTLNSGIPDLASALASGVCASKKMGALGRECKQMMMCYADAAASSSPSVDPDCLQSAIDKALSTFQRIEQNEICNTNGNGPTLSDDVDMMTDSIFSYLRGTGTTTTSTTTTMVSTTTSTMPQTCPVDGGWTPCLAYRDNATCKTCVDTSTGPDAGTATSLCTGAAATGAECFDAARNASCGYAINTATSCSSICCPP